jgi:methylmalonyl-CoA/ethylmalonyl-CoA epimerase
MTLHQVAQHAEDLGRATAFYRNVLGLVHLGTVDPPGLAFFDLGGGTRLLLEGGAPSALLYLRVQELASRWPAILSGGADPVSEPHLIHVHDGTLGPSGAEEWMAFCRDSEGNLVGLAELR